MTRTSDLSRPAASIFSCRVARWVANSDGVRFHGYQPVAMVAARRIAAGDFKSNYLQMLIAF